VRSLVAGPVRDNHDFSVEPIVRADVHGRFRLYFIKATAKMIGSTISHYQIVEKLGEGGMGVVYKARDLRLDRFVCIKILHPEQVKDESRKQRFIQEAKSASSLNHPNIITIHEIDQAGGTDFMVMEFVGGKTLQQLVPGGGMPLADVLKYAIPIARALSAANAAGIIHRDVKPGNIMVGANGIVKVLDFGLAKLTALEVSAEDATRTFKGHTEDGVIVGTAAYMSPEQAQGKPVDVRSDIFSFGAVLYEMLSGRRAFAGANHMSTLAAILEKEPASLGARDSRIPRELERVVMRCLRKDPERRFQNMADLRVALEELQEESDSGKLMSAQPARATRGRKWLVYGLSAALVVAAGAGGWLWWHSRPAKTLVRPLTRLTSNGAAISPAISPDGKLLAYQAAIGGPDPDIWVQQIGGKAIQITHEKEGATSPAFSPDGTRVVYESHDGIYEVTALGGDPRLITNDGFGPAYASGGSAIIFARRGLRLFTIPRMGGTPVAIQPDLEVAYYAISPDRSQLLALAFRKGRDEQDLKRWWVFPVSGGKAEEVTPPPPLSGEVQAPEPQAWTMPDKDSGRQWVIFGRTIGDTYNLFRVAVAGDGRVTSAPEQLTFTALSTFVSVSENGRAVFVSGSLSTNLWSIPIDANRAQVIGDRQSLTQVEGVREQTPSLSRDGKRVAFFSDSNLVVKDLTTGRETQLGEILRAGWPSISPDGSFVVYALSTGGGKEPDIYSVSTEGGGSPRLVCRECGVPRGFSSDGARLLTQRGFNGGLDRIAQVDVATGKVTDVLSDPQHNLWHPYYSWDDKWMSFKMQTSTDFNHHRLYITPVENFVPAGPDRWIQITSGEYNDDKPQLSPDGNTIYFTSNRDGFNCIWSLRLDRKTKRPMGAPIAIQHFHNSQRVYSGITRSIDMELNVARDKIVTNLDEVHSDIWMMELEPHK
jgi:serine/threonine protein kinase/Tol biopolymer transport system component